MPSGLQRELKQNRPFSAPTQEATVSLMRTADLVRRSIAAVVEPHGITPQQYNVLRILRGAGERGLPTLEIAERMIEQTPGITRLVDRLETKKLVIRERCATDRRQVFCRITTNGLDLLSRLDQPIDEAQSIALATLSGGQLSHLLSLLDAARNGLHAALTTQRAQQVANHLGGPLKVIRTAVLSALLVTPLLAQTPPPAPAPAVTVWAVDKPHSTATFKIRHLMGNVPGQFRDFDVAARLDRANPAASSVEFTIQAASIDTGAPSRDEHLRSPDFFEVVKYPTITFKSTDVKPKSATQFDVTGDLTMHGVTKRITIPVSFLGFGRNARGEERAGFEIETVLDRKDYGITWNRVLDEGGVLLGDEVKVSISLQVAKK